MRRSSARTGRRAPPGAAPAARRARRAARPPPRTSRSPGRASGTSRVWLEDEAGNGNADEPGNSSAPVRLRDPQGRRSPSGHPIRTEPTLAVVDARDVSGLGGRDRDRPDGRGRWQTPARRPAAATRLAGRHPRRAACRRGLPASRARHRRRRQRRLDRGLDAGRSRSASTTRSQAAARKGSSPLQAAGPALRTAARRPLRAKSAPITGGSRADVDGQPAPAPRRGRLPPAVGRSAGRRGADERLRRAPLLVQGACAAGSLTFRYPGDRRILPSQQRVRISVPRPISIGTRGPAPLQRRGGHVHRPVCAAGRSRPAGS